MSLAFNSCRRTFKNLPHLTSVCSSLLFIPISRSIASSLLSPLINKNFSKTIVKNFCEMTSKDNNDQYLVWTDCEMTGLDLNEDCLLEVAVILTDSNLNEVATCGPLILQKDNDVLDRMNDWCKKSHTKSGLVAACLQSTLTIQQLDQKLADFLKDHQISRGVLAGNSIRMDVAFLEKECKQFASLLSYRSVDVTSIAELARRWYPDFKDYEKVRNHRALDDIRESINQLKHLRELCFLK